jgi:hypothetical protein
MNKFLLIIITGFIFLLAACAESKEKENVAVNDPVTNVTPEDAILIKPSTGDQIDTIKKSLKAVATGTLGETNLKINYHSPAVRGRVIWGGLVPFDQVWVTGAHRATSIETDRDIVIGSKKISTGKYALFSIPGKEEWTIIINKKWDQHLADEYDINDDLVRFVIKPEMTNNVQERLMYQVKADNKFNGAIEISWEKIKLVIPVQVL